MILRHGRDARPIESKLRINPRLLELQTAKEILAEIFHAKPTDIDEMIKSRLEERSWSAEQTPLPDDGLWPATFCLDE